MASVEGSGTQLAVITTEHTLATSALFRAFTLHVDLLNMQAGDTVELRMYIKVLSGGASSVVFKGTFSDVPSVDALIAASTPIMSPHEVKATLKQTAGTGRNFPWQLIAV
jgi:hypothetical protein